MKKIVVFGANGGIGSEFVKQLAQSDQIFACSSTLVADRKNIEPVQVDILNEESIAAAAKKIGGEIDAVIVAIGILHGEDLAPEKSLRDLSAQNFERVFAINTIAPALIAKYFLPLLKKDQRSIFAALSARVGSISDNYLGGWYAYRASKAALNMVLKNAAIEAGRRNKKAIIAGLHPGTVDTHLSEPFSGAVKDDKLFTPAYSVDKMIAVLDGLDSKDSGFVFDYKGDKIEF